MLDNDFKPGLYWVRCTYTNKFGELDVYMKQMYLFNSDDRVKARDIVQDDISHLEGRDLGYISFRQI